MIHLTVDRYWLFCNIVYKKFNIAQITPFHFFDENFIEMLFKNNTLCKKSAGY